MKYKCGECGALSDIPEDQEVSHYVCFKCGHSMHTAKPASGDLSSIAGLGGGAMFGAAVGGPVGAVVGGLIGLVVGRSVKGIG